VLKLKQLSEQNLSQVEQDILSTPEEEFDNIYMDDEFLYETMEKTRNKEVFVKCMNHTCITFLIEKVKNPKTSLEMIFKLTLHPSSIIKGYILKREDVTPELLKEIIKNSDSEEIAGLRYAIINHKRMDEPTLYEMTDYDDNAISCLILLSNKVSRRIMKKLQNSTDEEVKTVAKVRDPETDMKYIEKVIKRERRGADTTECDDISGFNYLQKSYVINDILEGALRNPRLSSELVALFKRFTKTTVLTLVIPHPNVSDDLLDYYYKKGDDDVKKAVLERRKKEEQMH